MRQRQILLHDLLAGDARTGMAFAHTGMALVPLLAQELGSQSAMTDVWLRAKALYARGVGEEDSDVMQHRRLLDELGIEMQFRMIRNNLQRFSRYRLTMVDEDMTKFVILGIILINNCLIIHLLFYIN